MNNTRTHSWRPLIRPPPLRRPIPGAGAAPPSAEPITCHPSEGARSGQGGERRAGVAAAFPRVASNPITMYDRVAALEKEYEDVLAGLSEPSVASDQATFRQLSRRHKQLEDIVKAYRGHQEAASDLGAAKEMYAEASGDDRDLLRSEIDEAEARMAALEDELHLLLLPRDPNDEKNVIAEIRGAEGGEEANLFAKSLFEMYLRYADRKGWQVEVLGTQPSDMAGLN